MDVETKLSQTGGKTHTRRRGKIKKGKSNIDMEQE